MAGRGSKPGERRGGRKPGVPNKINGSLKEAILTAATDVGYDKQGGGGLPGYLKRIAEDDSRTFAGLLGRVLPLSLGGDKDNPIEHKHEVIEVTFVEAK